MWLDSQSLIVAAVLTGNLAIVASFSYTLHRSKSRRNRLLWRLVGVYGIVSTISVLVFSLFYAPNTSILGLSAGIFYLLVGSFVFAIEVPGYLHLTRYDAEVLNFLEGWRSEMVKLGYDFGQYGSVKSKADQGQGQLEELSLHRLVFDFVQHTGRIQNVDKGFWTIVISEVNRAIDEVRGRSKHPSPKLIDILSLSGLSFIIAQLLRFVG